MTQQDTKHFFILLIAACAIASVSCAIIPPAAWPATSYSPYFQNLFAHAQFPVAALPSGPGAQAPAIPIPGPVAAMSPGVGGFAPYGGFAGGFGGFGGFRR